MIKQILDRLLGKFSDETRNLVVIGGIFLGLVIGIIIIITRG